VSTCDRRESLEPLECVGHPRLDQGIQIVYVQDIAHLKIRSRITSAQKNCVRLLSFNFDDERTFKFRFRESHLVSTATCALKLEQIPVEFTYNLRA
jgi:hypothetical protein